MFITITRSGECSDAANDATQMEMECSCSAFDIHDDCEHFKVLDGCNNTRLKLRSILHRRVSLSYSSDSPNDWVALKVPSCENDDYAAWLV